MGRSIMRGTAHLTWMYISRLEGRDMGLGPLGPSRTHAAASTAFAAALEGHGRSQQIGVGQEDDLLSQRPAKCRPHRQHRPQSTDLQGFRADGTIMQYRPPVDRYRVRASAARLSNA